MALNQTLKCCWTQYNLAYASIASISKQTSSVCQSLWLSVCLSLLNETLNVYKRLLMKAYVWVLLCKTDPPPADCLKHLSIVIYDCCSASLALLLLLLLQKFSRYSWKLSCCEPLTQAFGKHSPVCPWNIGHTVCSTMCNQVCCLTCNMNENNKVCDSIFQITDRCLIFMVVDKIT